MGGHEVESHIDYVRSKLKLVLILDRQEVLDELGAKLLALIDLYGSILAAAKRLDLPYSSAWEYISRIERALGLRILEVRRGGRGGGGAKLTKYGKALLELYARDYRRLLGKEFVVDKGAYVLSSSILYAGSHDIALGHLIGIMREKGFNANVNWVGSLKGIASIMLNEADVAGIHLFDAETGLYNIPFVDKLMTKDEVLLVRGYEREQGLITREDLSYDEVIEGIVTGALRFINRVSGSGTRILADYVISRECEKRGLRFREIRDKILGYEKEVRTHIEVAEAIVTGEADVGVGIRWVADSYKLKFIPLRWEKFDFLISRASLCKDCIKSFINCLRSDRFRAILEGLPGYRCPEDMGVMITEETS